MMFKKVFPLLACCLFTAYSLKSAAQSVHIDSLPVQYHKPIKNALANAGNNRKELEKVLQELP